MLDHIDDIDADSLVFYGIDIRDPDCDIDAGMFFARAYRLFNYRGSMREELQAEIENNRPPSSQPATAPVPVAMTSTPPRATQSAASDGERWVTPDEMKALFPDLFHG